MLVNESAGFEEVENALIGQRKSASCNANLHFAALAAATPQYAYMHARHRRRHQVGRWCSLPSSRAAASPSCTTFRGAIINTEHQTNRNQVEAATVAGLVTCALRTLIILKTVENRNKETLSHVKNQSDSTWVALVTRLECAHTLTVTDDDDEGGMPARAPPAGKCSTPTRSSIPAFLNKCAAVAKAAL